MCNIWILTQNLATSGTQERFRALSFDSVFFLADQKENELFY